MKSLTSPEIDRHRIPHPMEAILRLEFPEELKPWSGAFLIWRPGATDGLRVIASKAGGPPELYAEGENWDHVSVSTTRRCPTWEEMCFIKEMFFLPDEVAMQLHPVENYINNHPYCLHLWRPIETEIPLPPSILVGLPELNR